MKTFRVEFKWPSNEFTGAFIETAKSANNIESAADDLLR
jgi:hypothetical protein